VSGSVPVLSSPAMTRTVLFVVLLGVAGYLGGCRRQDERVIQIDVPGMRTEAHARIVVSAIGSVPGVRPEGIKTDLANRKVTVTYESIVASLKNIEFAIADAGFSANDIPANAEAAARVAAAATNRPPSAPVVDRPPAAPVATAP
jgi:copper chaperone CopZ